VSETAERFLRTIAERLGSERVVEVYLFPPLRQGPLESAVAVVAVDDDAPVVADDIVDSVRTEPRHAIYTATYRYTRKGRDRGAWAVETVVRRTRHSGRWLRSCAGFSAGQMASGFSSRAERRGQTRIG